MITNRRSPLPRADIPVGTAREAAPPCFVSRRMPYAVQQFWDGWCAQGMDALKASSTATGLQVWGGTPTWGMVPAQPGVPGAQLGVLAPSGDRVGHIFPFVVAAPLVPKQQAVLLERAALLGVAWGDVINRAQEARLGIDELDAGLHVAYAESWQASRRRARTRARPCPWDLPLRRCLGLLSATASRLTRPGKLLVERAPADHGLSDASAHWHAQSRTFPGPVPLEGKRCPGPLTTKRQ